jgi:hypothetical protein
MSRRSFAYGCIPPSASGDRLGTTLPFAACNSGPYVAQTDAERLAAVLDKSNRRKLCIVTVVGGSTMKPSSSRDGVNDVAALMRTKQRA